jgi:hypothetical protein
MADRDTTTGRVLTGNNGGPGRKQGSKNKFQTKFWDDLAQLWEEQGMAALVKVLNEDTSTFVRVAAGLLPKEEEHKHTIESIRWLTEAEWLASHTSQEGSSDPTTTEPNATLASWPTDGLAKQ